jgi:hypothetical protein
MSLSDSELRRIARQQSRQQDRGRTVSATVVNTTAEGLVIARTIDGSLIRCRSITNRPLTPDDPVQVTIGPGQQLPLIDGIPQ